MGGPKKRIEALEANANIYLMNIEKLDWFVKTVAGDRRKVKVGLRKVWKLFPPERPELMPKNAMLIIDESSKFRNSNTSRFELITRKLFLSRDKIVLNMFKRRYILTGSPAPRSLMNLWAQLFILDLGESLGEYITHFRTKYFHPAGYKGYDWEIKPGSAKKIYKRIADRVLRIGEGVLKLPPKMFVERMVPLEEKARAIYTEMEREAILELEGETITAANAGVKTMKLRQLANGFVYVTPPKDKKKRIDKRKRKTFRFNLDKAEEAFDIVEETQGTPALIGYLYDSDLEALHEVFGEDTPTISAGTPDDEFNELEEQWNAGELPVLIAQIDIVSHGLNLQDTHASVIYYTIPWDYEAFEQFYRRVWRQGQKATVMIYLLLAEDTVDDNVVWPSTKKKGNNQQKLFDYLEDYMARRRKKFTREQTLTNVGAKTGMEIICATFKEVGQTIPPVHKSHKNPGGVLHSAINKRLKDWVTSVREEFIRKVAGSDYDGPTNLPTVRKMVEEILSLDVEKPMKEDTYKMWPGYGKKEGKMPTNKKTGKKKGFGSKKGSKKKVAKKKTGAKKVAAKKGAAKKKAPAKKVEFNKKATYVINPDSKKTIQNALRKKIVNKVKSAKSGLKATSLVTWATKQLDIPEAKAVLHINGCVKQGFIKSK
jgi:hypothetical protein